MNEYDSRGRTAATPLLVKSLDRIEALMRLDTPEAFESLQQELRAMAESMRNARADARTDSEALRGEKLLALLDQIEQRVHVAATKHVAKEFAPFRTATSRRRADDATASGGAASKPEAAAKTANIAIAKLARADRAPPVQFGDAPEVAHELPTAEGFALPAVAQNGPRLEEHPSAGEHSRRFEFTQKPADEDADVPFEMEGDGEPSPPLPNETSARVPAKPIMPTTSRSVAQRIAAGNMLPALAELTEEERLALFT